MDFQDIIGQEVLIQSLRNAIEGDMVANAYIFNGPAGSGKKTVADIFARAINCKDPKYKPCNLCSSCKKTIAKVNPDIIYIRPTGSSIKIEQIRKLISDISVKSYENIYRVIIVENADSLTSESQDAFLKTLEEPEGNNIFILLTENYNTLLPTIISRCQVYNFNRLNKEDMKAVLTRLGFTDPVEVEIAIQNSNGIIGRAIEMLKNKELESQSRLYEEFLATILRGSRVEILNCSDNLLNSKDDGEKLLGFLLGFFRDILVLKTMDEDYAEHIISKAIDSHIMDSYVNSFKEEDIFKIIDSIKHIITSMDFNVNYKNSIDSMLLQILEVFNDKSSRSTI
ncbi:DNA polymerase III subunit [Lutispora thermophila]|nr:AAA family ATPase [Lutispora thermophila]